MSFPFLQSDPTIKVAIDLLGARLYRKTPRGKTLAARIVETEAYLGLRDPACHSFHGQQTPRVQPLYRPAGTSYIYLIYGIYYCLNVVTGDTQTPEAVLIRAAEPLDGIDVMKKRRSKTKLTDLCSGPGKLAQALDLDLALNAHDLRQEPLWIEPEPCKETIAVSARIGLPAHKPSSHWPLRFFLADSPFVSPVKVGASRPPDKDVMELLKDTLQQRSWRLI